MKNLQLCQTLINAWTQDYQQLHDILNSEQLALEKRNFSKLTTLIQEKDLAVARINAQKIPPILDAAGAQITSMSDFKQLCHTSSTLNPPWRELMQLVEKCSLKNEVNARLIDLLNISSRRTLNLIKGVDPDNNIYNANGNRSTVRFSGQSLSA